MGKVSSPSMGPQKVAPMTPEKDLIKAPVDNHQTHPLREDMNVPLVTNETLNLWLWNQSPESKDKEKAKEECETLVQDMKRHSETIEVADIGADLWRHIPENADRILDAISNMPRLKWIQFSLLAKDGGCMQNLSISHLAQIVAKAHKLEFLILKNVVLAGTATEWKELASALKLHPSLKHLCLENYRLEDPAIDLGPLFEGLSSCKTLQALEIFYNLAPGEDHGTGNSKSNTMPPEALNSLLCQTSSLKYFGLCGVDVGDDHMSAATKSLRKNRTLVKLLVWNSRMTANGAKSLADALSVNKSLEILNLNDNPSLGMAGCQALFESFSNNDSQSCFIKELYVGCKNMDKVCRDALIKMIATSRTLKKVEVTYSWPGGETVDSLADFEGSLRIALRDSKSIDLLHLVGLLEETISR